MKKTSHDLGKKYLADVKEEYARKQKASTRNETYEQEQARRKTDEGLLARIASLEAIVAGLARQIEMSMWGTTKRLIKMNLEPLENRMQLK